METLFGINNLIIYSIAFFLIFVGAINTFFGIKIFKIIIIIDGFIMGALMTAQFAYQASENTLTAAVAGILGGIIISILIFILNKKGNFFISAVTGAFVGYVVLANLGFDFKWILLVILAGAFGIFAMIYQKQINILIVTCLGAWCITSGIATLLMGHEYYKDFLYFNLRADVGKGLIIILGWVVLGVVGFMVQYKLFSQKEDSLMSKFIKNEFGDEEEKDDQELEELHKDRTKSETKDELIERYLEQWGGWSVDKLLGSGSFGSVYKITKDTFGKKYISAMKFITVPNESIEQEALSIYGTQSSAMVKYYEDIIKDIINEISLLYSLRGNTNIVSYEDHAVFKRGEYAKWDIIIRMEFLMSLKDYIHARELTLDEIIKVGIDICTALEICSEHGIVHRDIKIENLFISERGDFKLGDFGISKQLSGTKSTATQKGTPLYMAPEVFNGKEYDATVDVYSLGIVLYMLLNHGRAPFLPDFPATILQSDVDNAIAKRLGGGQMPLPNNAEGSLGSVLLKACSYQAVERFQSPKEFREALERALEELTDTQLQKVVLDLNSDAKVLDQQKENKVEDTQILGVPDTVILDQGKDK